MRMRFDFVFDDKHSLLLLAKVEMTEKEAILKSNKDLYPSMLEILKKEEYPIVTEMRKEYELPIIETYTLSPRLAPYLAERFQKDPNVDRSTLMRLLS
jgi:hypothetical protein